MKSLLFACIFLLSGKCIAQQYLEPMIGFGIDVRKSGFRQINVGIQLSHKGEEPNEFVVQLKGSVPLSTTSFDTAFSPNPALPVYITVQKRISPGAIAATAGWRVKLAGTKIGNQFTVLPMLGVKYDRIGVQYEHDKTNYTILNPDETQSKIGLFGSLSAEYIHLLKKSRLFAQLTLATPVIGRNSNYPSSFHYLFPLSLNIGYSIYLKNR